MLLGKSSEKRRACPAFDLAAVLLAGWLITFAASATEISGAFFVDGAIAEGGTVTLFDRNYNTIDSTLVNAGGNYQVNYENPGLYYIQGVRDQALTGFVELDLDGTARTLDLNVLVTRRDVRISGQVTTTNGEPVGFAVLTFANEGTQLPDRVYTDRQGRYETDINLVTFDTDVDIDVYLLASISQVAHELDLPAIAAKQRATIRVDGEDLEVEHNVELPLFSRQIVRTLDLVGAPVAGVDVGIWDQSNNPVRLASLKTDSLGEAHFLYPSGGQSSVLRVLTQPNSTFIEDYEVTWVGLEPTGLEYDKRLNPGPSVGSILSGAVAVLDQDGFAHDPGVVAVTVEVMDESYETVASVDVAEDGFYDINLSTWGRFYIRAVTADARSPWRPLDVRSAATLRDITLDARARIVDLDGVVRTQSGEALGNLPISFSTDDLPPGLYRFGDPLDPMIRTNADGRYVTSLFVADEVVYQLHAESQGERVLVDRLSLSTYIPTVVLDWREGDSADLNLPNLHRLNVRTNAPDGSAYGADVSVLADGEFVTRVYTGNAGLAELALVTGDDEAIDYGLHVLPPAALEGRWFAPEPPDFSMTGDRDIELTFDARHYVVAAGVLTDANGLPIEGLTLGFRTNQLGAGDYRAGLGEYVPNLVSGDGGAFELSLRALEAQSTEYVIDGRASDGHGADQWGLVREGGKTYDAFVGPFATTITLAAGTPVGGVLVGHSAGCCAGACRHIDTR